MAGSFSDFLENKLLDHEFGNVVRTPPATLYVGLSTANPLDDGSGIAEPSGGSYARVAVTNNLTNWPASSGGAKSNGTEIAFPQATASWGTVGWFFISDAASGGNMTAHANLTTAKTIDAGDTAKFAIGDLDVTLD